MINLLPPDLKQAYRYAHRNVTLVRWTVAFAVSLVGLVVISTFGVIYIQQASRAYDDQIASAKVSLQNQQLPKVQAQVKDISTSLKLAIQVLSKEVLFSKLITQLATLTPNNVILTDLNISQSQKSIDISALTTDYAAATQLQVNVSDPASKLFAKADIVTINCGATSSDPHYPCTVTVRALFVKDNPYLFINDGKAGS